MFTLIITADQMNLILDGLKAEHSAMQKLAIFLPNSEWPDKAVDVMKLICVLEGAGAAGYSAQDYNNRDLFQ